MKKRSIIVGSLLLSCIMLITSCKSKEHTHQAEANYECNAEYHYKKCIECEEIVEQSEHHFASSDGAIKCDICNYVLQMTQEELFSEWVKGRDHFYSYRGDYTISCDDVSYLNDELYKKSNSKLSVRGSELYKIMSSYEKNENGDFDLTRSKTEVVKQVTVDGKQKHKYYSEVNVPGKYHTKSGSYVSPSFINNRGEYSLTETLSSFVVANGNTYQDFIDELNKEISNEIGIAPQKVEFIKDDIDSVTLKMEFDFGEEASDDDEQKVTIGTTVVIYVKVQEEKIVYSSSSFANEYTYEDGTKENYVSGSQNYFSYSFNEDKFYGLSIETDETENLYFANVHFYYDDYQISDYWFDRAYVDEKYTTDDAIEFLKVISMIHNNTSLDYDEYFKFYLDKGCTIPLSNLVATSDDDVSIYVRLELPEEYSAIVRIYQNDDGTCVNSIIINEANYTLDMINDYQIVSINGKTWNDGDSYELVCEGGNTYVIVFNIN